MYCGYDDDALAAWSLLLPKQVFEVQTAVDLASLGLDNGTILESSEPRLDGDLFYICDGDCGIQVSQGQETMCSLIDVTSSGPMETTFMSVRTVSMLW